MSDSTLVFIPGKMEGGYVLTNHSKTELVSMT